LAVDVGVGTPNAKEAPVRIAATVLRDSLFGFFKGGELPIDIVAAANGVDLRKILPKQAFESTKVEPKGTLNWDMKARVALKKKREATEVEDASLDGNLAIRGTIPIPGTKRVYENVDIALRAS